jgi:hypothetical protein
VLLVFIAFIETETLDQSCLPARVLASLRMKSWPELTYEISRRYDSMAALS